MRDVRAARIGAETDGDTGRQTRLGALDDALEHDLAVILLHFGRFAYAAVKAGIRHRGGERCYLCRAALAEKAQNFLVRLRAVLDRIHAVFERHAHALGTFDMRRNGQAEPVRLAARRADVLRRHFQLARLALFLCIQHAAGDHELDEIGFSLRDLSHVLRGLRGARRLVSERARHMPAGDGNGHVRGENAGPVALTRGDAAAQTRIDVRDAADGADRRNAAQKLRFGVALAHGECNAPRERHGRHEFYELAGIALLFGAAARGQMNVQVDEARHEISAFQIDDLKAGEIRPLRDDIEDLLAVRAQHHAALRLHIRAAVEQHAVRVSVFHRFHLAVFIHYYNIPFSVFCKNKNRRGVRSRTPRRDH